MKYTFREKITANGNMAYIEIPFNVWQVCKRQGMLKVIVTVESEEDFETQLIPKGQGIYYIPLIGKIANKYYPKEVLVSFEIMEKFINDDGIIETVKPVLSLVKEHAKGFSSIACIAMLTGKTYDEVCNVLKIKKYELSMIDMLEILDRFKVENTGKIIYNIAALPNVCLINTKEGKNNNFLIHYNGRYYDPSKGIKEVVDRESFISYLQIIF